MIEDELAKICEDILNVLDEHLVFLATSGEFSTTRCEKKCVFLAVLVVSDKGKRTALTSSSRPARPHLTFPPRDCPSRPTILTARLDMSKKIIAQVNPTCD